MIRPSSDLMPSVRLLGACVGASITRRGAPPLLKKLRLALPLMFTHLLFQFLGVGHLLGPFVLGLGRLPKGPCSCGLCGRQRLAWGMHRSVCGGVYGGVSRATV